MKILTILGARPQFIKAGSLSREIAKHKDIQEVIVHTGQHHDSNMSDIFFEQMHIPKPDYFLGVSNLSHGAMTARMMEKIEQIAIDEKPDYMVVYGDTNSTLAGALVASKLHIKLVHIEAGLRSYNMKMPEEVNRILTDRVSDILFCPTKTAVDNLLKEGFEHFDSKIVESGDIMQDGVIFYKDYAKKPDFSIPKSYALVTIHRAENTNDITRLNSLIDALNTINKEMPIVLPLHPRTKDIINKHNIKVEFKTIEPVGYLEMIWLIKNCEFVMSDSGGLQKEAYFLHKPCIVLRDETEWRELVEQNFNTLVGTSKDAILNGFKNIKNNNKNYNLNLYGDGFTASKIIKELLK